MNRASLDGETTSELRRQEGPSRQNDGYSWFLRSAVQLTATLLVAPRSLPAAEPNRLSPELIAAGWISLFDGETLFGWTPTSKANWKVEDGAITVSEGEQGFLATTAEFADFELHVEFKCPDETNSGVFLHSPLKPTDPAKDCYEVNIAPQSNPFPNGSLVGRLKNSPDPVKNRIEWSAFPPLQPGEGAAEFAPVAPEDEGWVPFDLRIEGAKVSVAGYGIGLYTYADPTPLRRGRIALQFREGPVAFRNIRLKPLGLKPMLNGRDLAGWNTANIEHSKFEITRNSELQVTNGRGILETDASYGDFVMQLDARVDGDGLNSGVFFRSIPREYANGYESQIHNAYKNNDPTQPADFGTGGIYRRVPARRVVSKDREWFTKTIVATGAHFAVWVDGYQVTDWTDERPEHDNPRNGLRLKPGTISLQGHDPTTNLRFRNLRIAELPDATSIED